MPNKPETRQAELSVILPELLKSFGNNPMTVDTIDVGKQTPDGDPIVIPAIHRSLTGPLAQPGSGAGLGGSNKQLLLVTPAGNHPKAVVYNGEKQQS